MFFIVKNHWEPYFTDNLRICLPTQSVTALQILTAMKTWCLQCQLECLVYAIVGYLQMWNVPACNANTRQTYPSMVKDWWPICILTNFVMREMVLIVVTLHIVEIWSIVWWPVVKVVVYQIIRDVTCDKYNTAMYWGRKSLTKRGFPLLSHFSQKFNGQMQTLWWSYMHILPAYGKMRIWNFEASSRYCL
jgi:hypothetical protein